MKTTAIKKLGTMAVAACMTVPFMASAEEIVVPLGDLGGRPMIEVYIGDHGPYNMIFDTGAPAVILNQDIGDKLGLEVIGDRMVGSPGGQGLQAVTYAGQTITIGDYSFEVDEITGIDFTLLMGGPRPAGEASESSGQPVRRVVRGGPQAAGEAGAEGQPVRRVVRGGPGSGEQPPADSSQAMIMAGPPPGVLGFWIFEQGVVGINFAANELTIDAKASLNPGDPGVLTLNTNDEGRYPWFNFTAGGQTVKGHIDTGAPGTFTFPLEWKDKLPLKADAVKVGEARLADGPREIWGAQLDGDLEIGNAVFHDPKISFMAGLPYTNIGSALFQNGGFRVDRENDLIELNIKSSE